MSFVGTLRGEEPPEKTVFIFDTSLQRPFWSRCDSASGCTATSMSFDLPARFSCGVSESKDLSRSSNHSCRVTEANERDSFLIQ